MAKKTKKNPKDRTLKNYLEYVLFLLIATPARLLPRTAALAAGKYLGRISQYLVSGRRKTTLDNLRRAFPEMPEAQLKKTVDATFEHVGTSAMEMLKIDQLDRTRDIEQLFTFKGLEHLREAFALNRGVFIITGHLGFWEVGTFFLDPLGFPADFVAKKMKNPFIDRYFLRMREAGGGRCIDSKGGARKILRTLGENRAVCVLMDQHISHREGIVVNFFNRPAYTTPIIAQMAIKQNIPVVPMFTARTRDNRYLITVEPMLSLPQTASPENVAALSQLMTDHIEKAVRQNVPQWLWLHRRWRD